MNLKSKLSAKIMQAAVVAGALGAIGFANADTAQAHGYVQSPPSRGEMGRLESNIIGYNAAFEKYGPVIHEPQSVEGSGSIVNTYDPHWWETNRVADGQLASAGLSQFSQLDEVKDWKTTDITPGVQDFTWFFTVGHRTNHFKYFITKQGWDSTTPLANDDLELLTVNDDQIGEFLGHFGTTVTHQVEIPADRTGYHVVLAVWDIGDTDAAFYNAIDLNIINDGVETPDIPTEPEEKPTEPEEKPTEPETPDATEGLQFSYNLFGGTATVTGYTGSSRDVIIPATVTHNGVEYTVTQIARVAFQDKRLTSVKFPNTLTYVDNFAFVNNEIERIEISSSDINFGQDPFRFNFLQYIIVPSGTADIMKDKLNGFVMGAEGINAVILEGTTPMYQRVLQSHSIEWVRLEAPVTYPEWSSTAFYTVGDRVTFNGQIWQSLVTFQGHGDENWAPGPDSSLWTLVE